MVTEAVILPDASFRGPQPIQHIFGVNKRFDAMPLRCNDIYIYVCLTHSKRLSLTHHDCSMPDTYIKRPCFSLLVASASVPS